MINFSVYFYANQLMEEKNKKKIIEKLRIKELIKKLNRPIILEPHVKYMQRQEHLARQENPKLLSLKIIKDHDQRIIVSFKKIRDKLKREYAFAIEMMHQEKVKPFIYRPSLSFKSIPGSYSKQIKHIIGQDIAIATARGKRNSNEDAYIVNIITLSCLGKIIIAKAFGIFDGHGGKTASLYISNNFEVVFRKTLSQLEKVIGANILGEYSYQERFKLLLWNAFKLSFVVLSQEMCTTSGTTALVALMVQDELWIANAGDSRAILQNGCVAHALTEDARADDPRYKRSILKRGGEVIGGRIDGILAPARALGDHMNVLGVHGCHVNSRPKINRINMGDVAPGSHILLVCDGVTDVASTRQLAGALYHEKKYRTSLHSIAENIVSSAYYAGSKDNISVMIFKL